MIASVMIELLALAAVAGSPQTRDCRAIADQSSRLACYDAREASPLATVPPVAAATTPQAAAAPTPALPVAAAAPVPAAASPSAATLVRADPTGKITSVVPLRHGLFRLTFDDGRAFDTASNVAAPPLVGASVTLRRTLIGTTFLDAPGRSPMAVRFARN
ncbi:hypothetical protein [Glacieibacterium sp.]|uniref:hypothetical protein n=1 Tax=Glacieibacterium sp. TaxID=2860237 RepID=UPI003B00F98F